MPTEQAQTYIWLLSNRKFSKSALVAARAKITTALPEAQLALRTPTVTLSDATKADLSALETALKGIPAIRKSVDNGTMTAAQAFQAYSDIIDDQFHMYYSETLDQGGSLQAVAVGAVDSGMVADLVSQELVLADGALVFGNGQMSAAERQIFISVASQRQALVDLSLSLTTPAMHTQYAAIENSAAYLQFESMESKIEASTGKLQVSFNTWNTDTTDVLKARVKVQTANGVVLDQLTAPASDSLVTKAVLAGGVGLAAVAVSVLLMLWLARKITRDLTKLDDSVRGMAAERPPRVVGALRRGDDVDVRAESPPPPPPATSKRCRRSAGRSGSSRRRRSAPRSSRRGCARASTRCS